MRVGLPRLRPAFGGRLMCGIAGAYWFGKQPADARQVADRMASAIRHRGPDSDGRSSTPFAEVRFKRLSIIDLTTGDQPLSNEDGSVECFLNGEIYNYLALRKELLARGHVLHTSSDTEVLPHLYEEMGEGMFRKLNGMFSICVVDHRNRTLLLGRDQFGVKQMYYTSTAAGVVFASEMKAVLASGLMEPAVDDANLVPYLALFYSPQPETLVKGVRKLSPGSFLKLQAGVEPQQVRYYQIPCTPAALNLSIDQAAERFTELFADSVRLQLQADVPIGISLSGGIDSSAIACFVSLARSSGKDLTALTISWPDTVPEELSCARELCQKLEMRQEILEPDVGSFETELPLLAWISDEPVADPATYSQFRVAQAAGERVKVLLGGAGGDELFGGYGHYVLPWKKATFARLPGFIKRLSHAIVAHKWIDSETAEALSQYRNSRVAWHRQRMTHISSRQESALRQMLQGSRSAGLNFEALFQAYRLYDPTNQQMLVDFHCYLPEQILAMMDRATMAASIEGRVPFLDVALVEFCFAIGSGTKLGWPPVQKRLLKQAIAPWVPSAILHRKKSGMPSHFCSFLAQHPAIVRELLLGRKAYVRNLFPRWVEELVGGSSAMQHNFPVLYALVVFEVWRRLFIEERIYDKPAMTLSELFHLPGKAMAHSN